MGFLVHLIVNVMLIVINLSYILQKNLIGWGIGIILHYLFGIHWLEKTLKEREAMAEYILKVEL